MAIPIAAAAATTTTTEEGTISIADSSPKPEGTVAAVGTAATAAAAAAAAAAATDSEKKKTQIRYDPDVPMTKEQLAAWRREARRVRNRESAAASRQRIRDRISELETEVDLWKTKFLQAQERLQQMGGGDGVSPPTGEGA